MALMRRCDAVLALPTWQSSQGAVAGSATPMRAARRSSIRSTNCTRWVDGKKVGTYNGQRAPLDVLLAGLPQTMLLRHADRSQESATGAKEPTIRLLLKRTPSRK